MSAPQSCCRPCNTPELIDIPGEEGANGLNAFTYTTSPFEVPDIGGLVIVSVLSSLFASVGQNVFVGGPGILAGTFSVLAKPDGTTLVLGYLDFADNTNAGTVVPTGAQVSPGGHQGPSGSSGSGVGQVVFYTGDPSLVGPPPNVNKAALAYKQDGSGPLLGWNPDNQTWV